MLLPIALIIVGVLLIVAEVYLIPGLNVIGIIGAIMLLAAIAVAFLEAGVLGGVLAMSSASLLSGGAFWWLWKSGAWNQFILSSSIRTDDKQIARESEQRARYLGKKGTAVTPLRPTGIAEIDGERIEVVTIDLGNTSWAKRCHSPRQRPCTNALFLLRDPLPPPVYLGIEERRGIATGLQVVANHARGSGLCRDWRNSIE